MRQPLDNLNTPALRGLTGQNVPLDLPVQRHQFVSPQQNPAS